MFFGEENFTGILKYLNDIFIIHLNRLVHHTELKSMIIKTNHYPPLFFCITEESELSNLHRGDST